MQDILEKLKPNERTDRKNQLLTYVQNAGGTIGNIALKRELRNRSNRGVWSDDMYKAIRDSLIESGTLETAKGQGGSVRKVAQSNKLTNKPVINYKKESELYDPIVSQLKDVWVNNQEFDDCCVLKTADGGSKLTGKWTRPDITVVGFKTFPYVPGKYLDVITFEVKPYKYIDISGVYEAFAHSRAATRSYLIVHIPTNEHFDDSEMEKIVADAGKVGIGLIVAEDPEDYFTWDFKIEARRIDPDPYKLNDFIEKQITDDDFKAKIAAWVNPK